MKLMAFLRAALTFGAGFMLCVFDFFGIGVILMIVGLLMFCMIPSASGSKKTPQQSAPKKTSAPRKTYAPVADAPAADAYAYSGSADRYFSDLLHSCFPDCTVRENVPPTSLGRSTGTVSWECSCGSANTGKFCSECGVPRPNASQRIVADSSTVNLSFVFYRNSQPLAAVILCSKYQWDTVAIANTMEACKKAKIPCLRFMREFRNSADYVVDRINSVLR